MARKKTVTPVVEPKPLRTPDETLAALKITFMGEWRKKLRYRRDVAHDIARRASQVLTRRGWTYDTERIIDQAVRLNMLDTEIALLRYALKTFWKCKSVLEIAAAWDVCKREMTERMMGEMPSDAASRSTSVTANLVKDNTVIAYKDIVSRYSDLDLFIKIAKHEVEHYVSTREVNAL